MVAATETETRAGRSRTTDTPDIQNFQKSLRLVLSKSSAFRKYAHWTRAASLHFCATAAAPMDHFARMQQSGGNQAPPVFPRSGNGFRLARLIGNAY